MVNEIKRDTVDYRDPTPFDNTKLNSLSDISKALRHKTYGEDTREAIAQQGEALAKLMTETGGNQSAEVVAARGKYETLGIREDAQDNAIDSKFSKTDGERYLNSITVVPETFANLASINAKYKNGANGVMVAADNGHKYIWTNNVWTDAGIYQSVGIADSSISASKIKSINSDKVSLNEFYDINTIPWMDSAKALTMSFDPSSAYFSATSAATQKDSGILFQAKRKAGSYTLEFWGVNSNMSGQGVYLTDASGTLKFKFGVYFANTTNNSETIKIGANLFDLYGIKIGDVFQVLIAIGSSESGGKNISGYVQLSNDNSIKKNPNLTSEIDNINLKIQKSLYQKNAIIDTKMTRWFSTSSYNENADGSLTYWSNVKGDPGPYYKLSQPISTGQTIYVYFEARKISGENAMINIQFLNDHIFDESPSNFRIADAIRVKLSNDWESYFVPVTLGQNWSKNDTSTAGATLSIVQGNLGELVKVQLRNPAFIHEKSVSDGIDIDMMDTIRMNQAIVSELSVGRRKGEFLPSATTKTQISKVHYVSPKSAVLMDNLYLDSLVVNLEKAEKVNFAIGAVDQNNLMIKSHEFSLDLPAGTKTIVFKDDIAVPAGNRLFMDCHNQGVLYESPDSTEKILVEDEDHSISVNGYSGYALYESTMMAPFSYRIRSRRLVDDITNIITNVTANSEKVDDIQKDYGILTSPKGKRYSLVVNDDGSLNTVSLQAHKAFIFGNSLTVGLDNYGMAASDSKHGWAYLIAQKFKSTDPDFSYKTLNGGENWESKTSSADRLAALNNVVKPQLDADTDLVIIQLTDNINTDAKRATFAQDAKDLITWFRNNAPRARVVWVASWFALNLIPDVQAACDERGALLCDISEYARPKQYKSELGNVWTDSKGVQHVIDNPGVASHPGNLGMQMIAQAVEKTLGLI